MDSANTIHLNSKLPKVGSTIFSKMSALAKEHKAINLSQGFPDFNCSAELIELVNKNMNAGHNQYAPMAGVPILREKIAAKVKDLYSFDLNPESEITITAGATQAIFTAIMAVCTENDEAILLDPCYDCYEPAIELSGAKAVHVPLNPVDFTIDWDLLKKSVNAKTRLIIINSPHNPSGALINAFDLMQLEKVLKDSNIIVLSDEVYEHIVFEGIQHQSVLRFPELAKRSIVISSFGKTYHNTGWKIGHCIAPKEITAEFRKVHQFNVFSVNTPIQYALAEYLDHKEHYINLPAFYQKKRDLFCSLLEDSKFRLLPSLGTYFVLADYSKISNLPDVEFAEVMTKQHGVAVIPVSVFYANGLDNKLLRFCFAKEDLTLKAAAKKLCKI